MADWDLVRTSGMGREEPPGRAAAGQEQPVEDSESGRFTLE